MTPALDPHIDCRTIEFQQNPYPCYAWLRRHAPAYFEPIEGAWWISRYEDIAALLSTPERLSSAVKADFEPTFIAADGPDYQSIRRHVSPLFDLHQAATRLDEHIATTARRLAVDGKKRGRFDLMTDFAEPLALSTIAQFLGIAASCSLRELSQCASHLVGMTESGEPVTDAAAKRRDARRWVGRHIPTIRELLDLPSHSKLNDASCLTDIATTLIVAGNRTVTSLVGNIVQLLLNHPREAAAVESNPTAIPMLIDEAIRLDTPLQAIQRFAAEDLLVAGTRIKRGERLRFLIGSANRDEGEFENADTFEPKPESRRHLGFGLGQTYCIGARLARLQASSTVEELFGSGLPPRLIDGGELTTVRWHRGPGRFVLEWR